jgi:hypothetical protein
MDRDCDLFPRCSRHGKPTQRGRCRECNAAYMRGYLRERRYQVPARSLWERARKRAKDRDLPFAITKNSISVPANCPALGLPLKFSGRRCASSPSLDRIIPERGYVPGNVRVISDRANRLKGNRSLDVLLELADRGPPELRPEYRMIAAYVQREELLREVRAKARQPGRAGEEWAKIAAFLDRVFSRSLH